MAITKKTEAGFTLIEVMIVVIIIAVLAAIALPSYQSYIQKSRRVDAREALTRIATMQERNFFQKSGYSIDPTLAAFGGQTSPEGWYRITITFPDGGCGAERGCSNYLLTATAIGAQLNDEKCRIFTIDQTLRQYAENEAGDDTSEECW